MEHGDNTECLMTGKDILSQLGYNPSLLNSPVVIAQAIRCEMGMMLSQMDPQPNQWLN